MCRIGTAHGHELQSLCFGITGIGSCVTDDYPGFLLCDGVLLEQCMATIHLGCREGVDDERVAVVGHPGSVEGDLDGFVVYEALYRRDG